MVEAVAEAAVNPVLFANGWHVVLVIFKQVPSSIQTN